MGLLAISCALGLSGCLLDESDLSEGPRISAFAVDPAALSPGAQSRILGTILTDSTDLSALGFSVWNQSKSNPVANVAEATFRVPVGRELNLETGAQARLTASVNACNGNFQLQIKARDGFGRESLEWAPFSIRGASCEYGKDEDPGNIHSGQELSTGTITLGSTRNSQPGSLDLDEFQTYKHSDAKAISGRIDLYYGTLNGSDQIMTPAAAKSAGMGATSNGPATWSDARSTPLRRLTLSQTEFDALRTQADLDGLWGRGSDQSTVASSVGVVLLAKANSGVIRVLRINNTVAGETGTVTLKYFR
jgi:hypothetical protein